MRILHINKYFHERDGVGRYMHDIMHLANARGHAVAVLAMHSAENASSSWEDFFVSNQETKKAGRGWNAVKQTFRAWWSREAYKKTRAIIAAFRPDVIHAHNLYTHLSPSVLRAAYDAGVPVVLSAHDYGYITANYGLFDGVSPLSPRVSWRNVVRTRCVKGSFLATAVLDAFVRIQRFFGMWTRGVTHILTASHAVSAAYSEVGYSQHLLRVLPLPSGVLMHALSSNKKSVRTSQVIFASRFEVYKGIDVVLGLAARMPDVSFVCVGQGSAEDTLRAAAAKEKNISLSSLLPAKDLWRLMSSSAMVLVPSRWPEPFGLVALEALSLGIPAIVSNRGGLPEIVTHGASGFIVPPDDLEAWEWAIRKALVERNASLLRKGAFERAVEVGNPEKHWEALFLVYQEAVERKGRL